MKNILLTGGAGFIGFHTTKKLLAKGYRIIIVDNFNDYYDPELKEERINQIKNGPNLKIIRADIADYKTLNDIFNQERPEIICHLAAQAGVRYSFENPLSYINSNLNGTFNLLELAQKNRISQFIFASSSSVYGNCELASFSETDRTDTPASLYAATKKAGEILLYNYYQTYGINSVALRFFTVYGPWGRPDMALFKFTKNILNGEPIEVYNQGDHQRDFTYIDDIVDGVVKAIEFNPKRPTYEIINLGNSQPVELERFIELIEKKLDKKAEKKYLPLQPGDVVKTSANITKAKELLNWQPTTNIETGINNFIDWYREYYK